MSDMTYDGFIYHFTTMNMGRARATPEMIYLIKEHPARPPPHRPRYSIQEGSEVKR